MKKFSFNVTQTVEVEIDETCITEEYLQEFSEFMWQVDDISDIAEYIARQKALYDGYSIEFVSDEWYSASVVDESVEEC